MKNHKNVERRKLVRVGLNLNGEFVTNDPVKLTRKLEKWMKKNGVCRAKTTISRSDKLDLQGVPGVQWLLEPALKKQYSTELRTEIAATAFLNKIMEYMGAPTSTNGQHKETARVKNEDVLAAVHQDHD